MMTEDDKLAEIACGADGLWSYSEEGAGYYQLKVSPAHLRRIADALSVRRLTIDEIVKISAPMVQRILARDIARPIEAYPDAPGDADGE